MRPKERLLRRGIMNDESAMRRALEDWSDRLSHWTEGFTAAVVLGLVIEYLPEVTYFLRFIPVVKSFVSVIQQHSEQLRQCGGFLVIVGVAGELWIDVRASRVETDLREESNSVIAKSKERLEHSLERQAKLEGFVGWLRLEKAPRWTRFDIRRLIGLLADKPTAKGEILYQPEDPEAALFADHILQGLVISGWHIERPNPIPPTVSGQLPKLILMRANAAGVTILVRVVTEDPDTPYRALFNAFLKLELVPITLRPDPALPEDTVRIIVGPKP